MFNVDLPGGYLRWGAENLHKWNLKKAFQEELKRRESPSTPVSNGNATPQQIRLLQRYGYEGNYSYQEAGEIITKNINPVLTGR